MQDWTNPETRRGIGAVTVGDVRARWATRRDEYRRFGVLLDGAKVIDEFLADLELVETSESEELVSLQRAASLSGYSAEHLARLVRIGRIPNAGRRNKPLIRRVDLPRKLGNSLARNTKRAYDPTADARALLSRRGER